MKEFDLIRHFFAKQALNRKDVVLGIGDDCAILQPQQGKQIAITTDTLVEGVHFPKSTTAQALGHKVLAVSLSDLAAVGAEPSWISLALTLPNVDTEWLQAFTASLFELCEFYNVQLVGGDTTQGPLSITVTAQGFVPQDKALTRAGAKAGDWLYTTGEIGDAALALQHLKGNIVIEEGFRPHAMRALDYPTPQVLAGQVIREYANSCIDVSDGLLADLQHVCDASELGVVVNLEQVPLSAGLKDTLAIPERFELALNGGDDYQLLFSVSQDNKVGLETALVNAGVKFSCIGQFNASKKITLLHKQQAFELATSGFEHFSEE